MENNEVIKYEGGLLKRVGNAISISNKLLAADKKPITILIANDHMLFRNGLKKALLEASPNIKVIAEAGSFVEIFSQLKNVRPDILITDDQMPHGNIVQDIPSIKKLYPDLKIIVNTMGASFVVLSNYIEFINGLLEFTASEKDYIEMIEKVYSGKNSFLKMNSENDKGGSIKYIFTEEREKFITIINKHVDELQIKYGKRE